MPEPFEKPPEFPELVRKISFVSETVYSETGRPRQSGIRRVAAIAVLGNPGCEAPSCRLEELADLGRALAELLMPELVRLLGEPAQVYGKAAIVGTRGQLEHGAALIHPRLGRPVRERIGGGLAVMPSNNKIGGVGSAIDVPLAHKDDAWSFAHLDTMTLSLSDAPREDEIALFLALASGQRAFARVGTREGPG